MSKKTRPHAPEYLADFLFLCTRTLIESGIDEEIAVIVSNNICERMCESWGKQLIYFPEFDSQERLVRNAKIFNECNGSNHHELAKKYDLSIQAVYRIYKSVLQDHVSKNQGKLTFD